MRAKVSGVVTPIGAAGSSDSFSWNEDLLMASFYQSEFDTVKITDGSAWCSKFNIALPKDGTPALATATNGLMGNSKCTWLFATEDGTVGPTLKLNSASYINFLFFWVEWLNETGLGSNGMITGDVLGNYKIGDYKTNKYLNVAKSITPADATFWPTFSPTYSFDEQDPSLRYPGSIGNAVYSPREVGPFTAT